MNETTQLWDWRMRTADLYAAIRGMDNPEAAWRLWRDTRDTMFATHSQTALDPDALARFTGLPIYPYDPALRFHVALEPQSEKVLHLPAGADGAVEARAFARTDGLSRILGKELTLYWLGGYGGGVLLPFSDATSGQETYGGGRYLLDTIKSADLGWIEGRCVLDLNFAYAPSCAHSPRFVCPLAPQANRLPMPVRGGERNLSIL